MKHEYRIVRHCKGEYEGETEYLYMIHEVYFDDNMNPKNWSSDGVFPLGEDITDLEESFKKYQDAFNKPHYELMEENGEEYLQEVVS